MNRLHRPPRFTSIAFRRQTPGSPSHLISRININKNTLIDPSHPAAHQPPSSFPSFSSPSLSIRLFPFAVLAKPDPPSQPPRTNPPCRSTAVPMSLLTATSKKRTSPLRTVRSEIVRRIKTCLTLLVTRGAYVQNDQILFDDNAALNGDRLIVQCWTYVFFPTLEIYRMPYTSLLPLLDKALRQLRSKADLLEENWARKSDPDNHKSQLVERKQRIPSKQNGFNKTSHKSKPA